MCSNKASAKCKTLYGWHYMCSFCLMNGHMLISPKDAQKLVDTDYQFCQCEHISHS